MTTGYTPHMASDAHPTDERKRTDQSRWPIARFHLGQEPGDDLSTVTTPVERIAMMWPLAESAWKVARRSLPGYDRRSIPARLFRAGSLPPDDE